MRGTNEELIAFVEKLKGQKVFIKGNHDRVSDYRYKQLFSGIYDYKEINYTPRTLEEILCFDGDAINKP